MWISCKNELYRVQQNLCGSKTINRIVLHQEDWNKRLYMPTWSIFKDGIREWIEEVTTKFIFTWLVDFDCYNKSIESTTWLDNNRIRGLSVTGRKWYFKNKVEMQLQICVEKNFLSFVKVFCDWICGRKCPVCIWMHACWERERERGLFCLFLGLIHHKQVLFITIKCLCFHPFLIFSILAVRGKR